MRRVLYIESGCEGLLTVNGQFLGPLEEGGQAFPMGDYAQAYIQFMAYDSAVRPLAAVVELQDGQIVRLEPQSRCFALIWPDGVVQLELRPQDEETPTAYAEEAIVPNTLLRYLSMQLVGDERAQHMLMRSQDGVTLSEYEAVVPLRFAPVTSSQRYDERAGLVRRIAPNAAVVDAALAATVPAGQGRRMIERIEIVRT